MFGLTIEGKEVGKFDTFVEAFSTMFHKVKEIIERGTSWQSLETACWIDCNGKDELMFYDAKDLAYNIGLLKDGELQDGVKELPPKLMEEIFYTLHTAGCIEDLAEMIARFGKALANI
jgi:hypothetical protein